MWPVITWKRMEASRDAPLALAAGTLTSGGGGINLSDHLDSLMAARRDSISHAASERAINARVKRTDGSELQS